MGPEGLSGAEHPPVPPCCNRACDVQNVGETREAVSPMRDAYIRLLSGLNL